MSERKPKDDGGAPAAGGVPAPHAREEFAPHFFEMDDYQGGAAVACGAPGISGQWVKGKDVEDAYATWDVLYAAGKLTE